MQHKLFIVQLWLKQFKHRLPIFFVLLSVFVPMTTWAVPTSSDQALRVVQYWLYKDQQPLSARMGTEIRDLVTFDDEQGEPLYHVANLNPDGFVIVSGDNGVEPIIAFVPKGEFDPSPETPLGAMVSRDIPQRVAAARTFDEPSFRSLEPVPNTLLAAQQKWIALDRSNLDGSAALREETIDDVRVPSFVLSRWAQRTEKGWNLCFNLFTPNNYPAGCTATIMSQIMRYFEYPTSAIEIESFGITVDGTPQDENLLGGNGAGGAYNWALMDYGPFVPEQEHRDAIGYLLHDTGVSINNDYTSGKTGGGLFDAATQLVSTFNYGNTKFGLLNYYQDLPVAERNTMINPNLDAGFPVILELWRFDGEGAVAGGHSVISDGYGYNNGTMYHHLNMGWLGENDAWYNLPDVNATATKHYTVFDACVYNIYPTGSGEIISGRVTDSNGLPLENVIVTAVRDGGGTYHSEPTGQNGIYALPKIPSASDYVITAALTEYFFNSYDDFHNNKVSTGTSDDYSTTVGNVWGINFSGQVPIRPTLTTQAVNNINRTTATGNGTITDPGNAEWIQHGMCWSESPNPNHSDECSYEGSVKPAGAFTSSMAPLLPGTTYYVRAYIFHMLGNSYGNEVTFTTSSESPPVVTTSPVTNIDFNTATSGGNVTSIGTTGVTQHGVCWGLNVNPSTSDSCTQQGARGVGVFISSLTDLPAGMKYHLRAYAINSVGTAYGADVSFTTDSYVVPSVTSSVVTDIGNRSATGHGSLLALGNPELVTQYGICWDTGHDPDISDRCYTMNTPQPKLPVTYTGDITGLTPLVTYYVRAYAINEAGIAYSGEQSFTTTDTTDLIVTGEVSSISVASATGSVYIKLDGGATLTQHGVCWSKSNAPTVGGATSFCSEEGGATKTLAITTPITGLSPGTTYYVRGYAANGALAAYGNEVSFTAASYASIATDIVFPAVDKAFVKGSILTLGSPNPTRHGFCWSTSEDPDTGDDCLNRGSVSATGPFGAIITELSNATTYHVRAYVTNNAGTRYGDDLSFMTSKASTVSTQAVSTISTTTATGNGTIVDIGIPNPTAHGICWSTSTNPIVEGSCSNGGAVSETGAFTGTITGLNPGTLYFVRAYATNSVGPSYGGELSFTALKEPTVTTQSVSSISSTTAIGNGNVTGIGVPGATAHGFCWSESANPVVGESCINRGAVLGTGTFTGAITGLNAATLYHARAYATNSTGIVYGADVSFTTAEAPSVPPFSWNLFLPAILLGSEQ